MVVCKPKFQSQFSIGLFVIICLGASALLITNYEGKFIQQLGIASLIPLGLALGFRSFWDYKLLYFGKGKVEVVFPFRRKTNSFSLKELDHWKEEKVKTFGTVYQEITLRKDKKKVQFSNQEFQNYDSAKRYLAKKAANKKA